MSTRIKDTLTVLFAFMLLFAAPAAVLAQETSGEARGIVTAGNKQEIQAGAAVIMIHMPTGTSYKTVTDKFGRFVFAGLRVGGPYVLTARSMGYEEAVVQQLVIKLGVPVEVPVHLAEKVSDLKSVTVSAKRNQPANRFGAGTNINNSRLNAQPTVSRSLQDITRLSPQATKDNSFAGSSFRYNNVTIDGAVNNDAIGFSPSAGGVTGTSGMPGSSTRSNVISLDAIQDVQVYVAPYDVKLGNFSGASVNAVTRSGSNITEGSVYAFGRNSLLVSKDKHGGNGEMPKAFKEYQAGARIGFPIIKNKLFAFVNMEAGSRTDPVQNGAGTAASDKILTKDDAIRIRNFLLNPGVHAADDPNRPVYDPGAFGDTTIHASSQKVFVRLDWNINSKHQLSLRNNTMFSEASNLERDELNFRFGSIAFMQKNKQSATVAELKSRFSPRLHNSLVIGYTRANDNREPGSLPEMAQVQIEGRTPGTTIFLGTDREASVFDFRQRTWELTNNLTLYSGKHTILFGTHNELYDITYNFVNSFNGRVDYQSGYSGSALSGVEAFLESQPARVRGNFNYLDNSRPYLMANPSARFNVHLLSAYVRDEIRLSDRISISPGIRIDYTNLPDRPVLPDRVKEAITDNMLTSVYAGYTYTPASKIRNDFFSSPQFSPRIGFNWDVLGNRSLVIRGGSGMFVSRIPFAWLGYAYYNNGKTFGSYDARAQNIQFVPGVSPLRADAQGIAWFAAQNGQIINNPDAGKTQADLIDNDFKMPKTWRSSLAIDYSSPAGYKFSIEAVYTKVVKDILFQQINLKDSPGYYAYDTITRKQPIFTGAGTDPGFTSIYLLSNTGKGHSYAVTFQVSSDMQKSFNWSAAYTYGKAKDISNGIRNSPESNWQLNQALNPNDPGLALSNFDIRHRIILSAGYQLKYRFGSTMLQLFGSVQSGSPFTYGFVNYSVQQTGQQTSLAYIPKSGETIRFFSDYSDREGRIHTAAEQAESFDRYIDGNKYLRSRRGDYTTRNTGRTPWNYQADLRIAQDFYLGKPDERKTITITLDIMNLTQLLNRNWGVQYFSPNTFNSTASVGLIPRMNESNKPYTQGGYPVYYFQDPGKPYSVNYMASRCQAQFGARYTF
ncbi:TonB-dependent receptor [Chitinophaga barathri]|uniref:TonB-dependent receptor n=1 Tax=Chitinophaga barathri TaxID=1647451 RepID=A0A3N4MHY7_9BACT|nr:carboxypeptidase regulatory-like domain-containing protein [Chitinophaga barathri]RPD43045.1 TonB-dependent receptor [Chitinophaga barathri]